jgi:acyl-coenzyme A synthetase/AMP-(fatty) acid ligase
VQFGVSESVSHWGRYRPSSCAISHNRIQTTYREFDALVNLLSFQLIQRTGDFGRIGILCKSKFFLLVALLSVLRICKSSVILNPGLSDKALETNIVDTGISILLHDSQPSFSSILENQQTKCHYDIQNLVHIDNQVYHGTRLSQPGDEWGVVFSSGTTGVPKGIERDHESIVTELLGWSLELNLSRKTCFYIGRPVYYTGGLVLALSTLLVGGSIIINDYRQDNDTKEIWDDYQRTLQVCEVSWAFFIPDQIRSFLEITTSADQQVLGATTILVMGGSISGEEKRSAVSSLGSQLVESWGNSESLGTITDPEYVYLRPNSIGRPFLTDQMYIVDDLGKELPPGICGRIAGAEEAGFLKYSNRPTETERVKHNGMIISDDIGYVDEEGYFQICGRIQDTIITTSGRLVFLPELEMKLRDKLAGLILECCVVHLKATDDMYELITAIVTNSTSCSCCLDISKLNECLAEDEQINRIVILESLPRVPSGKVDKVSIVKMIKEKDEVLGSSYTGSN